jgi:hypothetical protein
MTKTIQIPSQKHSEIFLKHVNVFRTALKLVVVIWCRTVFGSGFHSFGPATEKADEPITLREQSSLHKPLALDRRERVGWYILMQSARYCGADSCKHLNTIRQTLYSNRALKGSQWNEQRTGVTCSLLGTLVTRRAAEF